MKVLRRGSWIETFFVDFRWQIAKALGEKNEWPSMAKMFDMTFDDQNVAFQFECKDPGNGLVFQG